MFVWNLQKRVLEQHMNGKRKKMLLQLFCLFLTVIVKLIFGVLKLNFSSREPVLMQKSAG